MSDSDGGPADVLLVEDNPGDVRLTREVLTDSAITTTLHVVTDGVVALEFLHQCGEYADAPRPDVVLLDLNLPRKNGDEVLEEMRDHDDLRLIPVIVLTSSQAEEDVVRAYDLHANAYLTKSIDPTEFIETVRKFEQFWLEAVRLPPEEAA